MPQSKLAALRNAVGPELTVSRETVEKLDGFLELLASWQKVKNLVARSTLEDAWNRHIIDSAQLWPLAGPFKTWVDLGSGAGFPGLVIAILSAEDQEGGFHGQDPAGRRFHLIESNGRKVAFLREVVRKLDIPAVIHRARIEEIIESDHFGSVDIVSARALASLTDLFDFTTPVFGPQTRGLFLKGRDVESELSAARSVFQFEVTRHQSCTAADGVILEVSDLKSMR